MITKLTDYKLLLEGSANTIAAELGNEVQDLLSELDQELKDASEDIKEGLLTTASIVIALPAILGIISRFGKYASTLVSKVLGKKPNEQSDYNKWMTQLGSVADQLHHLYIIPIEKIVGKFFKDKHTAHVVANGIFHAMVAALLIASGVTAYKAFQAKNISLTTLESALTAIKSGELKSFFTDLISKA